MVDANVIKTKIHNAFVNVKRLPDDSMFIQEMDFLWVEGFIGGNESWDQLPLETIAHECGALRSVTCSGFQFLIPAYMCWVLENVTDSSNTVDHTIYALDASTHLPEVFDVFPTEQSEAICDFLLWAVNQSSRLDVSAAQKALDSYWGRFVAEVEVQ